MIKMYGLGIQPYFHSSFNRFDCAVSTHTHTQHTHNKHTHTVTKWKQEAQIHQVLIKNVTLLRFKKQIYIMQCHHKERFVNCFCPDHLSWSLVAGSAAGGKPTATLFQPFQEDYKCSQSSWETYSLCMSWLFPRNNAILTWTTSTGSQITEFLTLFLRASPAMLMKKTNFDCLYPHSYSFWTQTLCIDHEKWDWPVNRELHCSSAPSCGKGVKTRQKMSNFKNIRNIVDKALNTMYFSLQYIWNQNLFENVLFHSYISHHFFLVGLREQLLREGKGKLLSSQLLLGDPKAFPGLHLVGHAQKNLICSMIKYHLV